MREDCLRSEEIEIDGMDEGDGEDLDAKSAQGVQPRDLISDSTPGQAMRFRKITDYGRNARAQAKSHVIFRLKDI
jgi:hypothetical protein